MENIAVDRPIMIATNTDHKHAPAVIVYWENFKEANVQNKIRRVSSTHFSMN